MGSSTLQLFKQKINDSIKQMVYYLTMSACGSLGSTFTVSSVQCWNPDEHKTALHFRYAILFAQRGANLNLPEEILNNNYILVDIERIINCTLQRLDLEVLNFNLSNSDTFSRGQGMEFILRTEVLLFRLTFRLNSSWL